MCTRHADISSGFTLQPRLSPATPSRIRLSCIHIALLQCLVASMLTFTCATAPPATDGAPPAGLDNAPAIDASSAPDTHAAAQALPDNTRDGTAATCLLPVLVDNAASADAAKAEEQDSAHATSAEATAAPEPTAQEEPAKVEPKEETYELDATELLDSFKDGTEDSDAAPLDLDALMKEFMQDMREVDRHGEVDRVLWAFKLNPFEKLNLPFTATAADVKSAYRCAVIELRGRVQ